MKKSLFFVGIIIFTSFFYSCQKSIFCKNGKGEIVSDSRTVNNFEEIEFAIPGDLILKQSATIEITIEAQENLIDEIETNVSSEKLKIKTNGCIDSDKPIKVYISAPTLSHIDLAGSGNVYQEGDWNFNNIQLILTGSGNITFENIVVEGSLSNKLVGSGNILLNNPIVSGNIENKLIGSGNIDLNDLNGGENLINRIEGSGDISISSIDTCFLNDIDIIGDGNVHTSDLPSRNVEVRIDGSGHAFVNAIENLDVTITGSGNVYYIGNPEFNVSITGSGELINDN